MYIVLRLCKWVCKRDEQQWWVWVIIHDTVGVCDSLISVRAKNYIFYSIWQIIIVTIIIITLKCFSYHGSLMLKRRWSVLPHHVILKSTVRMRTHPAWTPSPARSRSTPQLILAMRQAPRTVMTAWGWMAESLRKAAQDVSHLQLLSLMFLSF